MSETCVHNWEAKDGPCPACELGYCEHGRLENAACYRCSAKESDVTEAEARGFAAGIEAAAKVADEYVVKGRDAWIGVSTAASVAGRKIAQDIRALTPKREGT